MLVLELVRMQHWVNDMCIPVLFRYNEKYSLCGCPDKQW